MYKIIRISLITVLLLCLCTCDQTKVTVETFEYGTFSISYGGHRSGAVVADESAGDILFVRAQDGTIWRMKEIPEERIAAYCRTKIVQTSDERRLYDIGTERFIFREGNCIYLVCLPTENGFSFSNDKRGPFYSDCQSKAQAENAFGLPLKKSSKQVPRI